MTNMIIDFVEPTLGPGVTSIPATYVASAALQALGVAATQGGPAAASSLPATSPLYVAGDTNTYTLRLGNARWDHNSMSFTVAAATSSLNFAVIPLGFIPTKVEVMYNNAVKYEWNLGQADTIVYTLTGPTIAAAANGSGYIQVVADAAGGDGNVGYLQIGSTIITGTATYSIRVTR